MSFFISALNRRIFKSLAKSLSVDPHVDDTCTKLQPCGASGRMHESNEGHPNDGSSIELTDEMVNTVVTAGGGTAAGVDARTGCLRGCAGCAAGADSLE